MTRIWISAGSHRCRSIYQAGRGAYWLWARMATLICWTEAISAVVVPKPGETIDPAELIVAMKRSQLLDDYKVPKAVIVVEELPKTSTGKIQKNVVRERHAAHYEG